MKIITCAVWLILVAVSKTKGDDSDVNKGAGSLRVPGIVVRHDHRHGDAMVGGADGVDLTGNGYSLKDDVKTDDEEVSDHNRPS